MLQTKTCHHKEGTQNMDTKTTARTKVKQPGYEVIKLFSCSTQVSMKYIRLINVKMTTNVGILTFIRMIIQHLRVLKQKMPDLFSAF